MTSAATWRVVAEQAPPPVTSTVTVLLVDDTPALRHLMRLSLEDTCFEVVAEAGDGREGVELVRSLRPQLVLLDLAMPVMDGLEALPLMREAVPGVTVVIVSGFERRAMESQVIEAGAQAYLQKGLAPDELVAALRELFPDLGTPAVPAPRAAPETLEAARQVADRTRIQALEEDVEELLYIISHDFSEPVHVITGFASRLGRRARTDEEGEFCEYIVEASERMQRLLDDLLEYARAGRGEVPQELLNCRRLVGDVLAGLSTVITESGARIAVGDLPHELVASRLVLTQVLHNLISNAIKFVRPGVVPQVRVDAVTAEDVVTFRVTDNGIGIPAEQHERVFQPFKRLHSRDRYPGTGIGLAICRRLVERQGGRTWVQSGEEGCTFFVEVPL